MAKNSCVDCSTPESIPATEILYAQSDPNTSKKPVHRRLPDPVSGYSLYPCNDENQTGFYIVVPQAANNLVTNPTFFKNLNGWSTFNSQISRTNAIAFDSGFSMKLKGSGDQVTAERREYAEISTTEFLAGYPYTFSMYVWTPKIWDLSDPYSLTISIADDLGNEVFSERATASNKWVRLEVTTIVDLNATELFLRANLRSQDQQENQPPFNPTGDYNLSYEYAYFDMGQLEYGVEATTPFHGDTYSCASCDVNCGGYQWSGVSHDSSSSRDSCVHDGGKLVCFADYGFHITSHTGHGVPPIRDISFPLNNRAGEFYQKSVADARIMTFVGQICNSTLKNLECDLFGLTDAVVSGLSPCSCCGKFLLVYRHGQCNEDGCNPDRDLAICVTYLGGLEGNRTNLYNQQLALQFKAHDPFWFEWPGHSSAALSYTKVIQTPHVVSFDASGLARGVPLDTGNTYTTIGCRPGLNSLVIGGEFETVNSSDPDRCEHNVAIYSCNEWEELCFGLVGGRVNDLTHDNQGNVLAVGSFSNPCAFVAVIDQNNQFLCFNGYPGGEGLSVAAPFWAQVAVGDANGLHIQDSDGNWTTYATNGPVTGLTVDPAGNIYAVGSFTTFDGVETGSVAFLNVNSEGCLSISNPVVESLGFTFNDDVNSIAINPTTGKVYIGGEFTQVTPNPVDICNVSNGTRIDSTGSNQQLRFSLVAGTTYRFEIYYSNIVARNWASDCINNNHYLRVTGQSSFGTNYSLLVGRHNTTFNGTATVVVGADTFYVLALDVDVSIGIGDPCETLNSSFVTELESTSDQIPDFAVLDLPGGVGIDDSLSRVSAQCITVNESFQGDTLNLNYVAQLSGGTLTAMDNGLSSPVNVVAVHPITHEVYAGTDDGLYIWNGSQWFEFAGQLGGGSPSILDIAFCEDGCSWHVLFDSTSSSVVPGITDVSYYGNVNPTDFHLIVHGPGKVHSFNHNGSKNGMRLCTVLECEEIADLDLSSGQYDSNFRSNLGPSILGGSRYDICLNDCRDNDMGIYISDDTGDTKATLLWREAHLGIESLCCKGAKSSTESSASNSGNESLVECGINTQYLGMHRDPDSEDCINNGIEDGTLWYNAASGCGLFISTGDCGTCEILEEGWTDEEGAVLLDENLDPYCLDDIEVDCNDL